jgi:hypothetical protein
MGRYRGRHRVPTSRRIAARIAATVSAVAAPFLVPGTAFAGMPANVRAAIVECESSGTNVEHGGDVGGVSTASGFYQFVNGTWALFGGREFAPRAIQASRAEQDIVADRAFDANGTRDWNASKGCWGSKVGKHSSGQEAPRHATPARTPAQHAAPTDPGGTYVVQPGDTLSTIAARNATTWPDLYEANDDVIDDPHRIYPGQRLTV